MPVPALFRIVDVADRKHISKEESCRDKALGALSFSARGIRVAACVGVRLRFAFRSDPVCGAGA